MRDSGLYIHIPFCLSRCHYCDFNTYLYDPSAAASYLDALSSEIAFYGSHPAVAGRCFATVYLGGGTPSLLTGEQVESLLSHVFRTFRVEEDAEVSMEANPGTVSEEQLRAFREAGVNRLSLGAQAFQESLLKSLGRDHTWREVQEAVEAARQAGFSTLNLDLMFGLPEQSVLQWEESVQAALALAPEHLSTYNLIIEEGTRFGAERRCGRLPLPAEEAEREMYLLALALCRASGYEHYEISNFARPGYPCRHNLIYWQGGEYLGVGAGAFSFWGGRRFSGARLPHEYIGRVQSHGHAVVWEERPSLEERTMEELMLGLRLRAGISPSLPERKELVTACVQEGLLEVHEGKLRATDAGCLVLNEILTRLT